MNYLVEHPKGSIVELSADSQHLFEDLQHETHVIHLKWKLYLQIYGHPETVAMINKHNPVFFGYIQEIIWDDISLSLARLGDKRYSMGDLSKENATLPNIQERVAVEMPVLGNALEVHLAEYNRLCGALIVRRKKELAHRDLKTMLERRAAPVREHEPEQIEEILDSLRLFLNEIDNYVNAHENLYEKIEGDDEATTMLELLKLGIRQYENQTGNS